MFINYMLYVLIDLDRKKKTDPLQQTEDHTIIRKRSSQYSSMIDKG